MRPAALVLLVLAAGCATPPSDDPVRAGADAVGAAAATDRPDTDPRTVDLRLAPDAAFLERHGAATVTRLREAVAAVDRALGPLTGLRFRIGGWAVFPATPGVHDDLRLLWEARLRIPAGGCDLVVAFTGRRGGAHAGACLPRERVILCAEPEDPAHNLVHETAHLFGARDWTRGTPGYGTPSVMTYDADQPRTLTLDAVNRARVAARAGALPARRDDAVARALGRRLAALPAGTRAALEGAFLAAESRSDQRNGLAASERVLADLPDDALASWLHGECRRLTDDPEDAAPLFLLALRTVAADPDPDALDRRVALEVAALAIDDVDRLALLRAPATAALDHLATLDPEDAAVLDRLASLRVRAGDADAGAALYRRAGAAAPDAAWPWRHLATLGRATGDAALWRAGWDGVIARESGDPEFGARRAAEAVRDFPALLRDPQERARVEADLDAARAAWPEWNLPEAVRRLLP